MTYKICAFCRFWQSEKPAEAAEGATPPEGIDRRAKTGICRRLAPRPSANGAGQAEWPKTAQRDWCGEWEGRDIEYRNQTQTP